MVDNLKKEDDLKNEDIIKNEDDLKNEKNEISLILIDDRVHSSKCNSPPHCTIV